MKICVRLSDPTLGRALIDLLRAHGHDACDLTHCSESCELRIQSDQTGAEAPGGHATLVLRRSADRAADPDPGEALRRALDTGGTAVWRAPLDVPLLVAALDGPDPAEVAAAQTEVPDLARAPHAWVVLDVVRGRVVSANDEGRTLLDLPADPAGARVRDLPIGGALRETLHDDVEGLRAGEVSGMTRTAAWWTDGRGHRIVCFLQAPEFQSPAARNRQSLAELGQMAATLAHEIRNPVASLAGALDLLESEMDPIDRAEILGMARARLKQLSRLLEKTLNLARPIAGSVEHVDVGAVIASAVSTLRMDPRFQDVDLQVRAPEGQVIVLGLESFLLQALTNVVLNAAQAVAGRGRVVVELTRHRRRAQIRVCDDGPGIPPDKHQEVFKPFYTTKPDGTGLGLPEVRRVMEAVGGSIVIEEVPEGACFRLDLPLAPDA